ncbi:sigma-54-dependent Fis family transcriptional regulator [Thalassobacillus devorans]|uniref:Sigma-54-dependent Fis family transcriptional regulator n=1 Tax=Thalassobacillus devorans TaxID=279813 RepID=A0ABQ1NSW0_9BACI|nr:sigma-54-dependent Fis family transcriptional regulator [Thalassobacillus devorans]NIK28705.1 transcriptional regulator with PAS, ATPase and Fis domain [Thalassobacillus devorans]GGC84176.1 sigma-54-dependent Fis family transcriptional regulator [Thalassobacillus devorans]
MVQDFMHKDKKDYGKENLLSIKKWMVSPQFIFDNTSVRKAAKLLMDNELQFLPIVDQKLKPTGLISPKIMMEALLDRQSEASVSNYVTQDDYSIVHIDASLMDVLSLNHRNFAVVDDDRRLIGLLTTNHILKCLHTYMKDMNQKEHSAEILNEILESAYEGVAVVDEHGIVREFNDAYSRFTGISPESAIGRHVEEVIDNTKLPDTLKTGMPERGVIQYIQGQAMIVHRIPIWKNDKVVGAIGILIFEGVTEVYRIYERLQENNRQIQSPVPQSCTTKRQEKHTMTLDQIIGDSESTSNRKRLARKVAKTDATVLITGESGTGKEMYARGIHHLSACSSGPFISVNCGAIPEHLFESELFGYEEGAFTGARKGGKPGKFELAENGTIFLDEIGEMPLMMQAKLLRVLQEKRVDRVGGAHEYEINARIIAATNRNLQKMVEAGDFREDLYYRLNIIEIPIPPLRDRTEDIPKLVSYYINSLCKRYQQPKKVMTSEALALFMKYTWPGNIRELINTLEKLIVLVDDSIIGVHHLPVDIMGKEKPEELPDNSITLIHQAKTIGDEKERELICDALRNTGGNKSKAAEQLGIHRTTLYQKIKKYQINKL